MKDEKMKSIKVAVTLLCGASLLGSGSCLPRDFWSDIWGAALTVTAETVFEATVLNQVNDALSG